MRIRARRADNFPRQRSRTVCIEFCLFRSGFHFVPLASITLTGPKRLHSKQKSFQFSLPRPPTFKRKNIDETRPTVHAAIAETQIGPPKSPRATYNDEVGEGLTLSA